MINVTYHGLSVDAPALTLPRSIWLALAPEELDAPDTAAQVLFQGLMVVRLESGLPGPAPLVKVAEALADGVDGVDVMRRDGDCCHWFMVSWQ